MTGFRSSGSSIVPTVFVLLLAGVPASRAADKWDAKMNEAVTALGNSDFAGKVTAGIPGQGELAVAKRYRNRYRAKAIGKGRTDSRAGCALGQGHRVAVPSVAERVGQNQAVVTTA